MLGRPLANTQIYILDKELQPVPVGVLGEIHIGGDGVTCGYLNLPELTAEKFIADPFASQPECPDVQDGRPGKVPARRTHRVHGSDRQPGEDPRLPH